MHTGTIVLSILAGVLGGVLAATLLHRRQVAGLRSLLERLESLARPETLPPSPSPDRRGDGTTDRPEGTASLDPLTRDVLAGRTDHVQALLDDGRVRGLPLADQAIVQIHAHLEDPVTPSELARCLNVSLRSLERGLALALDCTPRDLILTVKMREARRLLLEGEHNVTAVASRLGFSSPSHFSRRFREFYKQPPSELVRRVA